MNIVDIPDAIVNMTGFRDYDVCGVFALNGGIPVPICPHIYKKCLELAESFEHDLDVKDFVTELNDAIYSNPWKNLARPSLNDRMNGHDDAIAELVDKNEDLTAEVAALKTKVSTLETLINMKRHVPEQGEGQLREEIKQPQDSFAKTKKELEGLRMHHPVLCTVAGAQPSSSTTVAIHHSLKDTIKPTENIVTADDTDKETGPVHTNATRNTGSKTPGEDKKNDANGNVDVEQMTLISLQPHIATEVYDALVNQLKKVEDGFPQLHNPVEEDMPSSVSLRIKTSSPPQSAGGLPQPAVRKVSEEMSGVNPIALQARSDATEAESGDSDSAVSDGGADDSSHDALDGRSVSRYDIIQ